MSEHGHIKFWQEIGRRNVLRVAAVYIGFSWAVVHSGVVVGEALELPHWIMRFVSALLIVGFPAVVAFAWVYEITPEGLKRTEEVEKSTSITHRTAHRLNVVIIALIILLAGLYGADRFLLSHEGAEGVAHVAAEGAAKAPAGEGVSIAVLPFLNLSSDKEQEFFSDGMTEEITSALAKVKGLQVVGRTSAFEFKGQNKDLRAIGQALGATNLLEGSIRRDGNRIRVTGQLIRADTGRHIWTENYDRELTSVFAIQDDIAHAIAGALQAPLGLRTGESFVASRDIAPENYQIYLRAKAVFRGRGEIGRDSEQEAIALLEPLVAAEPGYAPAWALLAMAYQRSPQDSSIFKEGIVDQLDTLETIVESAHAKARAAAQKAIDLDPRNAEATAALALSQPRGDWLTKVDLLKHAVDLEPFNPEVLHNYSLILAGVGRVKEALALRQKLRSIEPLAPIYNANTAEILLIDGQKEAALALAKALPLTSRNRPLLLGAIYASMGRYGEGADAIVSSELNPSSAERQAEAARLLRRAPAKVPPQDLPVLRFGMTFVYFYVGYPERVSSLLPTGTPYPWLYPHAAAVRKSEAFKDFARKRGYVGYWRARGWPDMCHPVGADDFECS